MATVYRRRHNLVGTTLGAALATGATSITFAAALKEGGTGGTNIPTLGTDEYLPLTIEPDSTSQPEVVYLTAYTSGATSGTIVRSREDTVDPGVDHPNGSKVKHCGTKLDAGWLDPVASKAGAVNAKDDEFLSGTLDAAWTKVDYSNGSAVTLKPGRGLLSVKHTGGDAAQGLHAVLRSMSGLSAPVSIETAIRALVHDGGTTYSFGLMFADGTTVGSGNQVIGQVIIGSSFSEPLLAIRSWTGFNAYSADGTGSPVNLRMLQEGFLHIRLTWVSANTFRFEISPDGENWLPLTMDSMTGDTSFTMTPTQMGIYVSTYGSGSNKGAIFSFEHFRVS